MVAMEGRAVVLERTLPPRAASAAAARRLVTEALEATPFADAVDNARVAVSELVTNALVHAGTEIGVQVCIDGDGVLVEVEDGNPQVPTFRMHARESGTGRGLRMVEDLSDEWGIYHRGDGKVVWFRIGQGDDEPATHGGNARSSASEDVVQVELLEFPLLIHSAWQEHSATLLREYLLMSLVDGDEAAAFQRHAEACEALHLLAAQAPVLDVGNDAHRVMSHAVEPRVTAARLVLEVPRDMLDTFEVLESMMDDAVAAADEGIMLVPTTQPELREMRRWLRDQIRSQVLTGAAPEPYAADLHHGVVDEAAAAAGWDGSAVSSSDKALIEVNDSGQIVAVSPSAAEFLGYQPEHLVGQRVLAVIPDRFRQAHVAGMTLHLINGRRPLLDREVTVPMLRADGTERQATLVVRTEQATGQHGFVAEIHLP